VKLTTDLYLVRSIRINKAIHLLLLHVFTAWTGTTLLDGAGKEFSAPIEEDAGLTLNSLPGIETS
jgi:hypothetical protein